MIPHSRKSTTNCNNNNKIKYMKFYHNFLQNISLEGQIKPANTRCVRSIESKFWTEPKHPNKKFHTEERKKKKLYKKYKRIHNFFMPERLFVFFSVFLTMFYFYAVS